MPSIKDLFMAKAIAGANALGLILKNLILVSLWPLDDKFLECLIIFITSLVEIWGMLKVPDGFGMSALRKISGSKYIALKATRIIWIFTFQNMFMTAAILDGDWIDFPSLIIVDGIDIFASPFIVFIKLHTFLGCMSSWL